MWLVKRIVSLFFDPNIFYQKLHKLTTILITAPSVPCVPCSLCPVSLVSPMSPCVSCVPLSRVPLCPVFLVSRVPCALYVPCVPCVPWVPCVPCVPYVPLAILQNKKYSSALPLLTICRENFDWFHCFHMTTCGVFFSYGREVQGCDFSWK